MRIIFIGTVFYSEVMLLKLIELNANIVGVLTKEESKVNSDFKDLTKVSSENSIDSKYFNKINDLEVLEWIKSKKPDVIFVLDCHK